MFIQHECKYHITHSIHFAMRNVTEVLRILILEFMNDLSTPTLNVSENLQKYSNNTVYCDEQSSIES